MLREVAATTADARTVEQACERAAQEARLIALSKAHDVLTCENWERSGRSRRAPAALGRDRRAAGRAAG